MRLLIIFIFCIAIFNAHAQLCNGSLGDPIVNITFGSGTNPGSPLAAATTAYQYFGADCPNDGYYTVRGNTNNCFNNSWYNFTQDHTGNPNGYFMLVNASIQPSDFYVDTVKGLCSGTTFEFATWIMNVMRPAACGGNGIQPNITFSIEKTDGTVLGTSNTGNISTSPSPQWNQYGFFFTTPIGVSNIVLRMTNNATGGCGNDLALDDITFRACGPLVKASVIGLQNISDSFCQGNAHNYNFSCTVSAGLNNPAYQWQQSINGSAFTDIIGQNSLTLNKSFLATDTAAVYQYRLSVAPASNFNSLQCRTSSQPITISINPNPVSNTTKNITLCTKNTLQLHTNGGASYLWTGPNNFISTASDTSIPNITVNNSGKYYVLVSTAKGCTKLDSTIVTINASPIVNTAFTDTTICQGKSIVLSAFGNGTYQWIPTTGLINFNSATPIASPNDTTNYQVIVTNPFNCTDTAATLVNVITLPVVNAGPDKVIIAGQSVQLQGTVTNAANNFAWAPPLFIDSVQILNPKVNPPVNQLYYLTATNDCATVSDTVLVKVYNGIYIPNAFTPNGDGKNDTWNITTLQAYPKFQLYIYNRFGQMVFEGNASKPDWDGTFKGIAQPTGAYIYKINLQNDSPIIKGTVLLLR